MEADLKRNILEYIKEANEFIIPVYQRNYEWAVDLCKDLYEDILDVFQDTNRPNHFIGSVIHVESEHHNHIIIDGQQRITTLIILLTAIHNRFVKDGKVLEANDIKTILCNNNGQNKVKLKLEKNDSKILEDLLQGGTVSDGNSNIVKNYNLFYDKLQGKPLQDVIKGIEKLSIVNIILDSNDEPQLIFEKMNKGGLPLTQADLVRNFVFMGLDNQTQSDYYTDYWLKIEGFTKQEFEVKTTEFIKFYLLLKGNEKKISDRKIYDCFKRYAQNKDITAILTDMKKLAECYDKIINPEKEADIDLSMELTYIKELKKDVVRPFIMGVFEDYTDGRINKIEFIRLLKMIQSYLMRRTFCGFLTSGIKDILSNLYHEDCNNYKNYISYYEQRIIQETGNKQTYKFPTDDEVKTALTNKDVYALSVPIKRYIFRRLENDMDIQDYDVTRIFDETYKCGNNDEFVKKNQNNIANLTLLEKDTKIDIEYDDFSSVKQARQYNATLFCNQELATFGFFSKTEYKQRQDTIVEKILDTWKIPTIATRQGRMVSKYKKIAIQDKQNNYLLVSVRGQSVQIGSPNAFWKEHGPQTNDNGADNSKIFAYFKQKGYTIFGIEGNGNYTKLNTWEMIQN